MQALPVALLLLLALAASPASACAFTRMAGISGGSSRMPHHHHQRNLLAGTNATLTSPMNTTGKEWLVTNTTGFDRLNDTSGSAINAGNIFVAEGAKLKAMLEWVKAQKSPVDMCYWGVITMPTPNFNAVEFSDSDAKLVYTTMQDALKRIQGLIKAYNETFLFAAANTGHLTQHRACGLTGFVTDQATCSATYLAPTTRQHPTSSLMWRAKADGSNFEEIVAGLLFWFTDPEGHQSAMSLDIFERGWGNGYQVMGKLLPCSEIPAKYKGKGDLPMNAMGEKRPLFEEMLDTWSGLCNVWYDQVWSPAGGKCKNGTSTPAPATSNGTSTTPVVAPAARSAAGAAAASQWMLMLAAVLLLAAMPW